MAGRPFDPTLMGTLENLAHRGYTEGFLRRHNHSEYQNYDYGYSVSDTQQFVGEITGRNGDMVEVEVKNKFLLGNSLELMTPGQPQLQPGADAEPQGRAHRHRAGQRPRGLRAGP